MKNEVYSWRVSADVKSGLEEQARSQNISLSGLLDQLAREWLAQQRSGAGDEDAVQTRLRAQAEKSIGSISGGGLARSESVRTLVRERLSRAIRKPHGRARSH